jgi:hypothetical protein
VSCGLFDGLRAAFANPQVQASGMVVRLPDSPLGEVPLVASR